MCVITACRAHFLLGTSNHYNVIRMVKIFQKSVSNFRSNWELDMAVASCGRAALWLVSWVSVGLAVGDPTRALRLEPSVSTVAAALYMTSEAIWTSSQSSWPSSLAAFYWSWQFSGVGWGNVRSSPCPTLSKRILRVRLRNRRLLNGLWDRLVSDKKWGMSMPRLLSRMSRPTPVLCM